MIYQTPRTYTEAELLHFAALAWEDGHTAGRREKPAAVDPGTRKLLLMVRSIVTQRRDAEWELERAVGE